MTTVGELKSPPPPTESKVPLQLGNTDAIRLQKRRPAATLLLKFIHFWRILHPLRNIIILFKIIRL